MKASRLQPNKLNWKTFYPLVDTKLYQPQRRPRSPKFTTIGQWYWGGAVEVDGTFPDLSKKYAFEQYLDLPRRVPKAKFELAMHMNPDDPERERLRKRGWHVVDPHCVARTPKKYRSYLASASGFHFVGDLEDAAAAIQDLLANWPRRSREARASALEVFDSAKNLRKILAA